MRLGNNPELSANLASTQDLNSLDAIYKAIGIELHPPKPKPEPEPNIPSTPAAIAEKAAENTPTQKEQPISDAEFSEPDTPHDSPPPDDPEAVEVKLDDLKAGNVVDIDATRETIEDLAGKVGEAFCLLEEVLEEIKQNEAVFGKATDKRYKSLVKLVKQTDPDVFKSLLDELED